MDDVVEGGTDRRTGRFWGVVAACAVVALGVVALTSRTSPAPAARPGRPTPSPISQSEFGDPAGLDDGYVVPPPLTYLPRWGEPLPALLLGTQRGVVRRAPGGTTTTLPMNGRAGALAVAGGTVVVDGPPAPSPSTAPQPAWFVPSGGAPVRLGTANAAAPALAPGSVWLVTQRDGAPYATARLTGLDGRVRRTVRLPDATFLIGETPRGLLVGAFDGPSYVWDPASREEVEGLLGWAWRPSLGRWTAMRRGDCDCFAALNLDNLTTRELDAFAGATTAPTVSPDGRWAVGWVGTGENAARLRAVEVETGEATWVEGLDIEPTYEDGAMAWTPDSALVVIRVSNNDGNALVAWRAGTQEFGVVLDTNVEWVVAE